MSEERDLDVSMELVIELMEDRKFKQAREEILKYNEVDIAEIFEEMIERLPIEHVIVQFRTLPKDISVEVFSYLPSDDQMAIIDGITDKELSWIIEELDFDDKIDVLEELPANLVDKVLSQTPKAERKLINTFLNYPEDCAGSLMTPDYISLQENMTVRDALDYIKRVGMDKETVYTCYVKEMGRILKGIVSLRTLVICDDDVLIRDIMHTDFVSVNVYDDQEDVAEAFTRYGYLALPVVDKEFRLVGIITVDDIMDVIEEEATEDIERMAGVITDEENRDRDYLDTSVFAHIRSRILWLVLMMVAAMITGSIMNAFESMLTPTLVVYLPLLMGTAGNSGNQAASLVIRGIGVGDLDTGDFLRILWKELRVAGGVCFILAVINFLKIIILDGLDFQTALVINLALMAVVVVAKLLGGAIPVIAEKIGIDPALVANPMLASISDILSVTVYFALATLLLT